MVKRFVIPFAASGDKSVTPDATDPAGAISYSQGWPVAYQLADTDPNYRPVGRQEMNGVFNDVTGAIAELQTIGFPEWVAVAGLVAPYRINAYVRHNDIVWQSLIANNSDEPGVGAGATTWADKSALITGRLITTRSFNTPGSIVYVPSAGTNKIKVRLSGGGGAGGGAPATAAGVASLGGAGSAGSYAEVFLTAGFAGLTITVGAGGTGNLGFAGTNGGASSLGGVVSAPGGIGATSKPSITSDIQAGSVQPSAPTGANILGTRGNRGSPGFVLSPTVGVAGNGGIGLFGTSIGNGGDGSYNAPSTAASVGAPGAAGIVIIEEYT